MTAFSKEPYELKKMIDMIRQYERTGKVVYETDIEREMAALSHGTVSLSQPSVRKPAFHTGQRFGWSMISKRAKN